MKVISVDRNTVVSIASKNLTNYLSKTELGKYNKVSTNNKLDWLAGRIALKEALVEFLSLKNQAHNLIEINNRENGIPYFKKFPFLYCNISHSYGWGIASVSDKPTGVDIEKIRPHQISLLQYIATPSEIARFQSVKQKNDILVTKIWTIKEAILKGLGLGLYINPKLVNIFKEINKNEYLVNCEIETKVYDCLWKCHVFLSKKFYLTVATTYNSNENFKLNWYKPA